MKKIVTSLVVLALGFALPASAEIYKWKDKNGVTRYSDTPPTESVKQESWGSKMKPTGRAPLSAANPEGAPPGGKVVGQSTPAGKEATGEPSEDPAAEQRRRNAETEKNNKIEQEKQAKQRQENCRAAKANLEAYNQGGRIYKMNEKGERVYQSDEDLKAGADKSRGQVNEYCS